MLRDDKHRHLPVPYPAAPRPYFTPCNTHRLVLVLCGWQTSRCQFPLSCCFSTGAIVPPLHPRVYFSLLFRLALTSGGLQAFVKEKKTNPMSSQI